MLSRALACLALLGATPVTAQEQISPEAFLEAAVGNTLTFRVYGSNTFVGEEQFLRRDLSVWATADGRCTYGEIELRGPFICFIYEDFPDPDNCWLPFRDDRGLLVMSENREVQRVTGMTQEPISCEGPPLS